MSDDFNFDAAMQRHRRTVQAILTSLRRDYQGNVLPLYARARASGDPQQIAAAQRMVDDYHRLEEDFCRWVEALDCES